MTITDDISATVDLSTMVSGSPSRVSRGEELTYDYTVRNSGPAASTNTVVRSTLDRAVSFVSANHADKCGHSGGATGGERSPAHLATWIRAQCEDGRDCRAGRVSGVRGHLHYLHSHWRRVRSQAGGQHGHGVHRTRCPAASR